MWRACGRWVRGGKAGINAVVSLQGGPVPALGVAPVQIGTGQEVARDGGEVACLGGVAEPT